MTPAALADLLPVLRHAASLAAARIMADGPGPKTVLTKSDGSPYTATDIEAESLITAALRAHTDIPIIAEEEFEAGRAAQIDPAKPFFLVDALDGTREFIRGGNDFTVNIALIAQRVPVLGIILAPVMNTCWYALSGGGTYRCSGDVETQVCMRVPAADGLALLGGKKSSAPEVLEPFLGDHTVSSREQRSSSLKFCLLAEGQADLYPRLGETYEWDTAAGDIILREAGGSILDLATGRPIVYGKQEKRFINGGFVAGSRNTFLPRTLVP
ncbi:MAG: 3'(2'),5'-bisphosphate nucleotidase CysQ [Proteobacteria bacterium]|nr:3'(2'),5'-bisphosphate nucleotidase CysQ [Pseudomonadota bacterium]